MILKSHKVKNSNLTLHFIENELFIITAANGMNNTVVIIDKKFIYLVDTLYADEDNFNLTVGALRVSKITNAVSKLHKKVTIDMWSGYDNISKIISIK